MQLQNQTNDPEKLLKTGMTLIQDAFDSKALSLSEEITHWKSLATAQKQQILNLETDVSQLHKKITDMGRQIVVHQNEKKTLQFSKSALLDKYNNLRKTAQQLESFRKSIVSMVEFGPSQSNLGDVDRSFVEPAPIDLIPESEEEENNTILAPKSKNRNIEFLEDNSIHNSEHSRSLHLSNIIDPKITLFNSSGYLDFENRNTNLPFSNEALLKSIDQSQSLKILQKHSVDFSNISPEKSATNLRSRPNSEKTKILSKNSRSLSTQKLTSLSSSQTYNHAKSTSSQETHKFATTDAPTLYKLIRDNLSAGDFEKFAANVAAFNSSQQTAEETILNIGSLVKDKSLFLQMKTLILTAISESKENF
ncbi:hypothetical protein HK096_009669 [Nowakowskiella sp. JEL0078]|nr:hypothetical protein HK096_009669 [Nowakowskiella sp. JEL0078]